MHFLVREHKLTYHGKSRHQPIYALHKLWNTFERVLHSQFVVLAVPANANTAPAVRWIAVAGFSIYRNCHYQSFKTASLYLMMLPSDFRHFNSLLQNVLRRLIVSVNTTRRQE